jgi:hypothetical protein
MFQEKDNVEFCKRFDSDSDSDRDRETGGFQMIGCVCMRMYGGSILGLADV